MGEFDDLLDDMNLEGNLEGESIEKPPEFKFNPESYKTPNGSFPNDTEEEKEETKETRGRKKAVYAKDVIGDRLEQLAEKLDFIKKHSYQSDIRNAADDAGREVIAIAKTISKIL